MSLTYNSLILEVAGTQLGTEEWPGAKSNPAVEKYYNSVGQTHRDNVPWCAGFVNWVLSQCGLPTTGSLLARSFLEYGKAIKVSDAEPGDLVIFARGEPPAGHVAILVRFEGPYVLVRGGNQKDQVRDDWYPVQKIIGIRRADAARVYKNRPTLHFGDKGQFVQDLQQQLSMLGYMVGTIDGHFGGRTREAVLAFQADVGLKTDSVVGPRSWEALDKAKPRPQREVSMADLRDRGSETIESADKAQIGTAAAAGLSVMTLVTEKAEEASQTLDRAQGILGTVSNLVVTYWPALLVAGLAAVVWVYLSKVKSARLRDAQEGRNIGK